jgi:four helix bundle protein
MKLDHERLDVYGLARQLRREVIALLHVVPRGHGDTLDHLNRSSLAIKLTIAEGTGEFSSAEKARLYRIARREAAECGALLDDIEDLGAASAAELANARTLIVRIVSALVRLSQAHETTATRARVRRKASAATSD